MELYLPNTGGADSVASVLASCTLHHLASVLKIPWSFYCLRRTLDDKEERVSSASWSKPSDLFFSVMWLICYATARWGSIVLMFISLRALPAGSYTTVDWLSSIPHI